MKLIVETPMTNSRRTRPPCIPSHGPLCQLGDYAHCNHVFVLYNSQFLFDLNKAIQDLNRRAVSGS